MTAQAAPQTPAPRAAARHWPAEFAEPRAANCPCAAAKLWHAVSMNRQTVDPAATESCADHQPQRPRTVPQSVPGRSVAELPYPERLPRTLPQNAGLPPTTRPPADSDCESSPPAHPPTIQRPRSAVEHQPTCAAPNDWPFALTCAESPVHRRHRHSRCETPGHSRYR